MVLEQVAPIESNPLRLTELPDPQPAAGEVRVRVRCCAICRTDLHVIEGDLGAPGKLPLVIGHQAVGVVDRVGAGCKRLREGARVGIAWLRQTDGSCRFCTSDRENLCENSRYTGFHDDGGYAELATVPESFAYEIPETFDEVTAAPLLCAGMIGYRALRRSQVQPGQTLAIFGFGSSAHIVMQIALHRSCRVYVVTRGPRHQNLARELGATWVGDDATQMPTKAQSAIVFAPSGPVVLSALSCLERGGTVALAGIHMSAIPSIDYDRLLFGERDVHPVTANTRADARELLLAAVEAQVKPRVCTYPLENANVALQQLKKDQIEGTAVLLIR